MKMSGQKIEATTETGKEEGRDHTHAHTYTHIQRQRNRKRETDEIVSCF